MVGLIVPLTGSLAAQALGGGGPTGIVRVASQGGLPEPTGSGALRYLEDQDLVVVDSTLGSGVSAIDAWVPAEAGLDGAGDLASLPWIEASGGTKARLWPGDSVGVEWTTAGTVSTAGGKVSVSGYSYLTITSTYAKILVVQRLRALPGGTVAESGIAAGSVVGGQGRWINTRCLSTGAVTQGTYQSITNKGRATGAAGKTIWTLIDQSSAKGPIRTWGDDGGVVVSDLSDMSSNGAYFQVMSVNSGGTGVTTEWDFVGAVGIV